MYLPEMPADVVVDGKESPNPSEVDVAAPPKPSLAPSKLDVVVAAESPPKLKPVKVMAIKYNK